MGRRAVVYYIERCDHECPHYLSYGRGNKKRDACIAAGEERLLTAMGEVYEDFPRKCPLRITAGPLFDGRRMKTLEAVEPVDNEI